MNKLIKKVNQEVNNKKNDILKFLSEYVSHQSVNPTIDSRYSEKKCQEWLFNEIKSWKCFSKYDIWEEEKDRPNILVKLGKKDTKNDLMYFMGFRFIGGGGIPYIIQNFLPILFNMSIKNYLIATFLGCLPTMFIIVAIGSGLGSFVDQNNEIIVRGGGPGENL